MPMTEQLLERDVEQADGRLVESWVKNDVTGLMKQLGVPPLSKAADTAQIRALVYGWAKAVRAQDADGVMRNLSPDVLADPESGRASVDLRP